MTTQERELRERLSDLQVRRCYQTMLARKLSDKVTTHDSRAERVRRIERLDGLISKTAAQIAVLASQQASQLASQLASQQAKEAASPNEERTNHA